MSHFCVYVFVKPNSSDRLEQAVEGLLAPYCECDERFFEFVRVPDDEIKTNMEFSDYDNEEEMAEDYGFVHDKDGHICRMLNPNAKYDYYGIGMGFCHEIIEAADGTRYTSCRVNRLPKNPEYPFAMVTSDGVWDECGQMGWFAMSDATDESKEAFRKRFVEYVQTHQDETVVAVNCHI